MSLSKWRREGVVTMHQKSKSWLVGHGAAAGHAQGGGEGELGERGIESEESGSLVRKQGEQHEAIEKIKYGD